MKRFGRMLMPLLALLLIAGLGIMIGGCKPKGGGAEKGKGSAGVKEYKIGAIFSVTGKASFLGDPEKKTIDMLVEELNKNGGINGAPVKFIIEDDAGDEVKTKAAAQKLIDKDQVLAIIGPSQSGATMAIKDLMAEKKVPLISCAAAEAIVNPVNEWVFKTPQKDSYVAELILKDMNKNGIKNIAMLSDNTGFGQEGAKQVNAFAGKYGVTLSIQESDDKAATEADIETLLTKVKADKGVQAVINWSITPSQSVVPRKMKQLDMSSVKLYQSHGFGNIKYVEAAGDAANGIVFPAGRLLVADSLPDSNPQKKVLVEYKNAYETKFKGENVSTFGGHAYDAFWIVVKAIEKAGADRAKIREAIEGIQNFPGTGGVFNFSKQDHNGLTIDSLEMLTVKDGKFALLNQ